MKSVHSYTQSRGFSLVELMISMVIAMIVLAGVINSFLASRTAFRFNEELAYIQDNARYATAYLTKQIRMAGYFGCDMSNAVIVNSIMGSNYNGLLDMNGIEGWDDAGNNAQTPILFKAEVINNTDAVIVRSGDQDNSMVVEKHNVNAATIHSTTTHNYEPGTVFMIADTDCQHVGIFMMTGPTNSNGTAATVGHNAGGGTTPQNCSKAVKGSGGGDTNGDGLYDCNDGCGSNSCSWSNNSPYQPGSSLMQFNSVAFYVKNSAIDNTMPVLAMRRLLNTGVVSPDAEELVPGIEDFQLTFGVDTDDSGIPDQFLDATGVVNKSNWQEVIAVRLQMVARSENTVLESNEARTLLGVNYNDRYLRQLVTTTVRIRNK